MCRWSEIVIAPDNETMAWTSLLGMNGAANYIGKLVREPDAYRLADVHRISTMDFWQPDEVHPGYYVPGVLRGGEIKQFVEGGLGISMAGNGAKSGFSDSVVQELPTGEMRQITFTEGYDETTIFSPDERLGIVMSTRFSPETNCAILAHVPRPFSRVSLSDIIMPIYLASVASVRGGHSGNIGPALIEIDRSLAEPDYMGYDLHDPEDKWVYCSPISWHPDGVSGMWNEVLRGEKDMRIRIVRIQGHTPGKKPEMVNPMAKMAFAQPWIT